MENMENKNKTENNISESEMKSDDKIENFDALESKNESAIEDSENVNKEDFSNSTSLENELLEAEKRLAEKKNENEKIRQNFGDLGKSLDLGHSQAEQEEFEKEVAKLKSKIESQKNTEPKNEKEDCTAEEILEKVDQMPEDEKAKIEMGAHNIGFVIEKYKAEAFSKLTGVAARFLKNEGSAKKFLEALSTTYKKDAELQDRKIENANTEEGKKALKTSNRLKLGVNILKVASYIGSGPAMTVSSVFSRGMETVKAMRLGKEEVLEKNRIHDENEAAEEAWRIYEQSKKDSEKSPSKLDLQRTYEQNIPTDVLKRLSEGEGQNKVQSFMMKMMQKPFEMSAMRLEKRISAIENSESLSAEEKEARKNKLLDTYSKTLNDLDGIVSRAGEVDTVVAGLKYAEVAGKMVMGGVMAKTAYSALEGIWNKMPEVFSTLEESNLDSLPDENVKAENAFAANFKEHLEFQGGNSIWKEAENQLNGRMKDYIGELEKTNPQGAEAMKLQNVDKIKDLIVQNPEKYGLPENVNFNQMTSEQIASIKWDNAVADALGKNEFAKNLEPANMVEGESSDKQVAGEVSKEGKGEVEKSEPKQENLKVEVSERKFTSRAMEREWNIINKISNEGESVSEGVKEIVGKNGSIARVGYGEDGKPEWMMIKANEGKRYFIDTDLDGKPDRLILNKSGKPFDESRVVGSWDEIKSYANETVAGEPQDIRIMDIDNSSPEVTTKLISFSDGRIAESGGELAQSAGRVYDGTLEQVGDEDLEQGEYEYDSIESKIEEDQTYEIDSEKYSGKVKIEHDANGEPEVILKGKFENLRGNEALTSDYRRLILENGTQMSGFKITEAQDASRKVSMYTTVYEELSKKQGNEKSAEAVLKAIKNTVESTEKSLGVKVFDREKVPGLK